MADAPRPRQASSRTTEPAVARRAHQPSGSRGAQLARRISPELPALVCADLARSLLPGRYRQQNRRDLEQALLVLHRKLRQVPGAEDAAERATAGRLPQSA